MNIITDSDETTYQHLINIPNINIRHIENVDKLHYYYLQINRVYYIVPESSQSNPVSVYKIKVLSNRNGNDPKRTFSCLLSNFLAIQKILKKSNHPIDLSKSHLKEKTVNFDYDPNSDSVFFNNTENIQILPELNNIHKNTENVTNYIKLVDEFEKMKEEYIKKEKNKYQIEQIEIDLYYKDRIKEKISSIMTILKEQYLIIKNLMYSYQNKISSESKRISYLSNLGTLPNKSKEEWKIDSINEAKNNIDLNIKRIEVFTIIMTELEQMYEQLKQIEKNST